MPSPKATELFHRALEIAEAGRDSFLHEATSGDSRLEKEVQALLRAHRAVGGFLQTEALPGAGRLLAVAPELPTLAAGEVLEDFEIVRLLGRGGFAAVYLARQRSLDRLVALKVSSDAGEEARTLAPLEHAHIVRIFSEHRFATRGLRAICLQYVEGPTLRQVLEQTPPAKLDVWRLGWQLAEALDYAHRRGVLHLDLKPENIFITPAGNAMLVDFNVGWRDGAKNLRGGTFQYMPPEQERWFRERATGTLDGRADIFSLGRVLGEVAERQGGLVDLTPVVARCTQPDPSARFATAGELARALKSCGRRALLRRMVPAVAVLERRPKTGLAAAIAVAPLLLGLLLANFWQRAVINGIPFSLRWPMLYPWFGLLPGVGLAASQLIGLRRQPRRWLAFPAWLGISLALGAAVGIAAFLHAQFQNRVPAVVLIQQINWVTGDLAVGINFALLLSQYICWALVFPGLAEESADGDLRWAKQTSRWCQAVLVCLPIAFGLLANFPVWSGSTRRPVLAILGLIFAGVSGLSALASAWVLSSVSHAFHREL